jgi:choline-sulfatase
MTPEQKQIIRTFYYGKITLIDDGIGLILRAMAERGLLDNTWIVYTSDHGEMLGDHFLSHKIVFYEGALKIPCIFRPPGGIKGWKSDALTDQIDVAATLLDIAGAKPFEKSDGRSLFSIVKAGPGSRNAHQHKDAVFSEVNLFSMVLTDRYKMAVSFVNREPLELYDMVKDPNEINNLVQDPSLKKVREELNEQYISQLMSHTDQEKLKKFQEMMSRRSSRRAT